MDEIHIVIDYYYAENDTDFNGDIYRIEVKVENIDYESILFKKIYDDGEYGYETSSIGAVKNVLKQWFNEDDFIVKWIETNHATE